MDEQWRDWHESVLMPLIEFTPGEQPSPKLEQLLARDPSQVDLALLAADTDRTQEYVFESVRLPEIRGASEKLQELNHSLPSLITTSGFSKECVLLADGGALLALVPQSIAPKLVEEIERTYPSETGAATITCVSRPVSAAEVLWGYGGRGLTPESVNALRAQPHMIQEDWQRIASAYGVKQGSAIPSEGFAQVRGFGQMVRVMGTLLRQRKDCPPLRPIVEAWPFAMRCRACQVRPAERMYVYYGEQWPLCDVCARKTPREAVQRMRAHSKQVARFLDWLKQGHQDLEMRYMEGVPPDVPDPAQDVNELGEACKSRPGYIGFIYADGNHIGKVIESLPTPRSYRQFSDVLDATLRDIVHRALAENLHPTLIDRASPTGKSLGEGYIHPLEPLFVGGDDLMLIVPGDAAIPIAVRLCQLFENEMSNRLPKNLMDTLPESLRRFTLSAGVVIADSHNPVRVLQQVSKELAKNAKRRAHDEERPGQVPTSALDFLLLKSQSMLRQKVKQIRLVSPYFFRESKDGRGRRMTAAPYTLKEAQLLLELLKRIRALDLPTSQLQGLVAALQEGRQYGSINYRYQQARLAARLGEARKEENVLAQLPEIWPFEIEDSVPWHRVPPDKDGRQVASILPDLLELSPFVPRFADLSGDARKVKIAALWQDILSEVPHAG
jgi:CRISPR-associated protein Cmr2